MEEQQKEKNSKDLFETLQEKASQETLNLLTVTLNRLKSGEIRLDEIEKRIRKGVLTIGANILETAIQLYGTGYIGAIITDKEGRGKMRFVNNRPKKVLTLMGEIEINRAYYHGEDGESRIPLDENLCIQGMKFSPGVREAVAITSAEISFENASKILQKLSEISISKERVEEVSQKIGKWIENKLQATENEFFDVQAEKKNLEEKKEKIEILYISTDGTCVNTIESWKEVKSGVIFEGSRNHEGPVRGKINYLGSFQDSESFGRRLYMEAVKHGLESAKEIVVLGDGAKWIWNESAMNFPGCVEIVDWYHAVEKLWDIGKELYPNQDKKINTWVSSRKKYLKAGKIEQLIYMLKRSNVHKKENRDLIAKTIGYYQNNKERMRYQKFRKKKYFIGSGAVEGSCKHVIGERLKKSGMKWTVDGGNAILQLRICCLNKTWGRIWAECQKFC